MIDQNIPTLSLESNILARSMMFDYLLFENLRIRN